MVHANAPEKGQARGKRIHLKAGFQPGPDVFEAVGKGVGQLHVCGGARLVHMVSRNADAVEFRHVPAGVFKDIRDQLHRGCRGIDIGVADHEFLQDVVLDGA